MEETVKTHIISQEELMERLAEVKGARIVSILTETDLEMLKTANPYVGRVKKRVMSNVVINFIYANSVNNQREKEGVEPNFMAQPRMWGVRINGTPFVLHKDKRYLECRFLKASSPTYVLDGREVVDQATIDSITSFIPNRHHLSYQGVKKEIALMDYKMESIKAIQGLGNKEEGILFVS